MAKQMEVAVVAGVGPGLGAALCRTFVREGYHVVGLARRGEFGLDLAHELGNASGMFTALQCDVSDTVSVDAAFAQIERTAGSVCVYVHNASHLLAKPFLEITPEAFTDLWRVTCLGALNCAQKVIPGMLARRRGVLLFTGATASVRGGAGFAAFASAKFALRGLTHSLAREFGPHGIHVAHVVIDGIIWSERTRMRPGLEEGACLMPEAIAETYLHLVRQERSAWTQELDLRPDREKF